MFKEEAQSQNMELLLTWWFLRTEPWISGWLPNLSAVTSGDSVILRGPTSSGSVTGFRGDGDFFKDDGDFFSDDGDLVF